jgi:NodT family efflux transporter outer membrane factor (OMF) lipoprotein
MMRLFQPQKWLVLAAGIGCCLFCPGCASMPSEVVRAEFDEPPPMERTLAKEAPRQAATVSAWPGPQWWREFGSPDLDQVMELALRDNPGLKKAYARLGAAEGVAQVEGARLLPWWDASGATKQSRYSAHGVEYSYNPALGGAEKTADFINPVLLRYEFDFWGKNRAAFEAALGEAAAENAEFADAWLMLTTAIARAYIRGVSLAQQLVLAQDMVELRRQLLQVEETRFRTGLATDDVVKAATIELENAIKREAGTRALLVLHQDLLAQLMGEGPDATQDVFMGKKVTIPMKISLPPHLPIELLAHRPDLAAAMHRAEAAGEQIHVAKAQFLPSVDLEAAAAGLSASVFTYSFSSLLGYLFKANAFDYAIMPGVHLPIFEGGMLRGQLTAARAAYDQAVELYNATLLHAVQEVADGLNNWKETGTILVAHDRLLVSARGEVNLTQVRLRSGLNDRREVLASQIALLDQQYVLRALEADHLFAMVDIIQALGGGYSSGIEMSRPHLAPEEALSGLETKTPAWALDSLASPLLHMFATSRTE